MNYQSTLEYLFALQRVGIKLGLENILALLDALDNPQNQFPAIHIAGTNGKGSTGAMIASILRQSGLRVGFYTSPHLVDFSERIRVNQQSISTKKIVALTARLRPLIEKIQPSFFEVTTAMAFWHFAAEKVDVAVVETGLGGRLDATNLVNPLTTLITPVDFDHQNFLGNSIEDIASEKAGIIKPGVACLTNNRRPAVLNTLAERCRTVAAKFINVNETGRYEIRALGLTGSRCDFKIRGNYFEDITVNLPGKHQLENALLALSAIIEISDKFSISQNAIIDGMKNPRWRGRLHQVSENPRIIIDVSHNPSGFANTFAFLRNFFQKDQIRAITFLQNDKDFSKIGEILIDNVHDTRIVDLQMGKPLAPRLLLDVIKKHRGVGWIFPTFESAIKEIENDSSDHLWLIIGSHYLAGEAYRYFQKDLNIQI